MSRTAYREDLHPICVGLRRDGTVCERAGVRNRFGHWEHPADRSDNVGLNAHSFIPDPVFVEADRRLKETRQPHRFSYEEERYLRSIEAF